MTSQTLKWFAFFMSGFIKWRSLTLIVKSLLILVANLWIKICLLIKSKLAKWSSLQYTDTCPWNSLSLNIKQITPCEDFVEIQKFQGFQRKEILAGEMIDGYSIFHPGPFWILNSTLFHEVIIFPPDFMVIKFHLSATHITLFEIFPLEKHTMFQ